MRSWRSSDRTAEGVAGPATALEFATPAERAAQATFHPTPVMWLYFAAATAMYASGVIYVLTHNLSVRSLFLYRLLQPRGIAGAEARLVEIATPRSRNLPLVLWLIYLKASAVLVELFQYWFIGMLIAGGIIVFVSWEKVKARMGYGGFRANLLATTAGAVIPICSCGILPVLAGMVQAGIPLGPTMAFLVAAPMLNVPTVFMTAGVLGWPMALGRTVATFGIALVVGGVLSRWQRQHRRPRVFLKIHVPPRLSPELQQFAFRLGMLAAKRPDGVPADQLGPEAKGKLGLLEEAGLAECRSDGRWVLVDVDPTTVKNVGACAVLPEGDVSRSFGENVRETARVGPAQWLPDPRGPHRGRDQSAAADQRDHDLGRGNRAQQRPRGIGDRRAGRRLHVRRSADGARVDEQGHGPWLDARVPARRAGPVAAFYCDAVGCLQAARAGARRGPVVPRVRRHRLHLQSFRLGVRGCETITPVCQGA
jgi:uncharacterized membrane protein YraQ (UPF0718 family)